MIEAHKSLLQFNKTSILLYLQTRCFIGEAFPFIKQDSSLILNTKSLRDNPKGPRVKEIQHSALLEVGGRPDEILRSRDVCCPNRS